MSNTIQEWARRELIDYGLSDHDAAGVIEQAKTDPTLASMEGRWCDREDSYPFELKPVLWLNLCSVALKWIDANCPAAWFRPLFDKETSEIANVE